MRVSPEPLFALTTQLGIGPQDLAQIESPSRLAGTYTVSGASVAQALTAETLDSIAREYGDAMKLTFRLGALDEFTFAGSYSAEALSQFRTGAETTYSYEFLIEVEKGLLVTRLLDGEPTCEAVLYFSEDAVVAALRSGIESVEKMLWLDASRRLLVLVLDRDVSLCGDSLSIVGGRHLDSASSESHKPPINADVTQRAAQRRDEYIGWDTQFTTRLTPWHFYIEVPDNSIVAPYIDAIFVVLVVLFTCDRARPLSSPGMPARIQTEFRGREHVAFVPISEDEAMADISALERNALRGLVDWTYQTQSSEAGSPDWLPDRLPFVQMRVAQALEGRPEETRVRAFASSAPEIYQGAQWQWRAFLEGKVSNYLDRVRQIEGVVADAVDQYAARTADLAKGLSDTMLAAIAALIGSFIAGAFAHPFDVGLFRIGLFAYAGYVLIFPGAIGLLSSHGQASEIELSFEAQRKQFEDALYTDKVNEIIGTRVNDAENRYCRWLRGVAAGYLAVTVGAVVGALIIPHFVGS